MKKIYIVIFLLIFLILSGIAIYNSANNPPVHYHAGFQIYMNGKLQDYSSTEFMHLKPCGAHENTGDKEDEQLEKAHLHDNVGDVVHVHREGVVWNDVFTKLKVTLPSTKSIAAYINGKQISDVKTYPIKPYDSLVLMIGKKDTSFLKQAVTMDHIKKNEKKSESCGS